MDDGTNISHSQASLEFTEIPLDGKTKVKLPKRRVFFSDGYLDEYSTDDEADDGSVDNQPLVDINSMTWLPYLWYLTWLFGSKALAACDYLGEHLAYFLGITTPKFQYELDQAKRILEEEETLKKQLVEDNGGWNNNLSDSAPKPIETKPVLAENIQYAKNIPPPFVESNNETNFKTDSQSWERY